MSQEESKLPPRALLFISKDCSHCDAMLTTMSTLVKHGEIGRLEVVNVSVHPDRATELHVRTVPWVRIGPFSLEGKRSLKELRSWCVKAASTQGMADYFHELLMTGKLQEVESLIDDDNRLIEVVAELAADSKTNVHVRVGIAALLEGLQGTGISHNIVHELGNILTATDARLRSDAAHYLALTESAEAIPYLEQCLNDEVAQVREIATEALNELQDKLLVKRRQV